MAFRKIGPTVGLLVLFASAVPRAQAQSLWYNGDYADSGLSNGVNIVEGASTVFDDFTVTDPTGWHITSLFSNNQMDTEGITQASWSIRSGVSAGDGGSVLFSGTSAATQTLRDTVVGPGYNEYQILVSGLNIDLAPGTYWIQVSPVGTGLESSFISNTVGINAVGLPAGDNDSAFFLSDYYGADFSNTTDFDPSLHDFSMGINGVVVSAPEPGSLTLIAPVLLGLAGLMVVTRLRQSRKRT